MHFNEKQLEILNIYKDLALKLGRHPNRPEMTNKGISRNRIRDHFSNMGSLQEAASKHFSLEFKKTSQEKAPHKHADFTKEALGNIIKENDFTEGTFFITAVSPVSYLDWSEKDKALAAQGLPIEDAKNVFAPGFKAVKNFLKRNNAELVLLPMPAHVKALQEQPLYYDPRLKKYRDNFATEYKFNTHLQAIEAHLNPQMINPLTGLKRLRIHKYTKDYKQGQEIKRPKTSIIVAHSKQMMEVVPTGNESHPRLVHSTGCITKPSYLRNRIGMLADNDHKMGGLIVEIQGDNFWLRQAQFNVEDGSFVDMGTRYHADGTITKERALACKVGDLHCGFHSDEAIDAMYELWDIIQPKKIFFEDIFDSSSISHHLANKRLTRAKMPDHFLDLPTEIEMAKKTLNKIWDKAPKDAELIATASNHHDHVMKYLDEGRYINDCKANYDIAHRMVVMALDGENPLKEYLDPDSRMIWTDQNEDIFVEGCQMNSHGHLGINGSKGNKIGLELAFGNAMTAHTHTPSVYHDLFTVGHMSKDRHGYNVGPGTWIICLGAVYKYSQKQLYFIIKGSAFRPIKKTAA